MSSVIWTNGTFEDALTGYGANPFSGSMPTISSDIGIRWSAYTTAPSSACTTASVVLPIKEDDKLNVYIQKLYGAIRKYPDGSDMSYYCQYTINTDIMTFATMVASTKDWRFKYRVQLFNYKDGYFKDRVEFSTQKELEKFVLAYRRFE